LQGIPQWHSDGPEKLGESSAINRSPAVRLEKKIEKRKRKRKRKGSPIVDFSKAQKSFGSGR
jgi:hypothetical protein